MTALPTTGSSFKRLRFFGLWSAAVAFFLAGNFDVQAYEIVVPELFSNADMACASITGYALTHSEDKILPLLKLCGENANKNVCEITISMMKDFDRGKGSTYGLTCVGAP